MKWTVSLIGLMLSFFLSCTDCREESVEYVEHLNSAYIREHGNPPKDGDEQMLELHAMQALESSAKLLEDSIISKEHFIQYVLPVYVNRSDMSSWRTEVHKKYRRTSLIADPISYEQFKDSCTALNQSLGRWFRFGYTEWMEESQSFTDLTNRKIGTCIGMTDLATYTFRALGVPVSIDMVPVWGNTNTFGHRWNVLMTKKGKIPFMGTESGIGDYEPLIISRDDSDGSITRRIPPKVYRFCDLCPNAETFDDRKVIDVTADYVPTADIIVDKPEEESMLNIAIFTKGKFITVAHGKVQQDKILFADMAKGLLYFVISNTSGKVIGYPIYHAAFGQCEMKPKMNNTRALQANILNSIPASQLKILAEDGYDTFGNIEGRNTTTICPKPINGKKYDLYIWDGEWAKTAQTKAKYEKLRFSGVPENAVFIIAETGQVPGAFRPFIFHENEQIWL